MLHEHVPSMPLLICATHDPSLTHVLSERIGKFLEALTGITAVPWGWSPVGRVVRGTLWWLFRLGRAHIRGLRAYVHVHVNKTKVDPADWHFMTSGLLVTEKFIAPAQISHISSGPDEGMSGSSDSLPRTPGLTTPWASPMDEVLKMVMWFRCPDHECRRCVPCGFIRGPFCGFAFSCAEVKDVPKDGLT